MNVVILVSLLIRFVAVAMAIRISRRHRDRRVWLLAFLIVLTCVRQLLSFAGIDVEKDGIHFSWDIPIAEVWGLAVSILVIPSVYFIGQLLDDRKKSIDALSASDERVRACLQNTPNVAVQWYDEDGRVLMWNPASEQMFGWKSSEAMGKRLHELIHTEEEEIAFRKSLAEIKGTGRNIGPCEFTFRRRDGSVGQCESTLFEIPGEGDRSLFVCMDVDLSDRVRVASALQLREAQLRLFVEHAPAAIAMLDKDMRYLVVSRRWTQDYRLSDPDIIGRTHYEVFPEVPERWKKIHERCLKGAVEKCEEDVFPRADGTIDWVRWEVRPWNLPSGEIGGIIMFTEVITDRMKTIEALRWSEARYRVLVDNLPVIAWEADAKTFQFSFIGGKPREISGFLPEEWMAPNFWIDHVHPEDLEQAAAYCRRMTAEGKAHDFEYRMIRKDGTTVWLHDYIYVEELDGGHKMLRGLMVDISESKKTQARLVQSEERLRTTIEAVRMGFWEMDIETHRLDLSPEWYQLLGHSPDDFPSTAENAHSFFHPDDREQVVSRFDEFTKSPDTPFELEFRMRHRDGTYRWWLSRGYAVEKKNGHASIVRGVNIDVTEQRRISAALQDSEERFRGIADHGSVGIWQITLDQRSVYANRAMCELLEVDNSEQLIGHGVAEFFVGNESGRLDAELIRRRGGKSSTYEMDLVGRRGTRRRVLICGVPLRGPDGSIQGSIGTFTDITALKNAEQSALESRERFAGIVQSAMDGIVSIDASHNIVLFNTAAENMFCCKAADVLGQPLERLIPVRFRPTHSQHVKAFHTTGTTTRRMGSLGTVSGVRYTGEEFPIEASISQMDAAGKHYYTVILRDIGERIKQDQDLKESRELLERAQEVGRVGSWWSDIDFTGGLKWSDEAHRIFGISREQFDERVETFFNLVHPDDREMVRLNSEAAISGERRYSVDHRIIRPDGVVVWLHEEADVVRDAQGRAIKMIGVCQDITERKQAENLEQIRTFMLEGLTTGRPLSEILEGVVRNIEQSRPGLMCSILLLDATGRKLKHGAAPSLPDFYNQAVDGIEIGEGVGSCGTSAHRRKPVIVTDINNHPFWAPFKALAERAKLGCCWSFPIMSAGGMVAGTFAVYRREPGEPTKNDLELIETAAHFISVAIERKRAEEAVLAAKQALVDQQRREKELIEAELAKLRDELVLKTRLATIGQVSASIAHELRNPLGAVRNAAYFLKRRAGANDEKLTEYLTIIEHEVETSDRIISNLMEMTRAKLPEKQLVNFGEIFESIIAGTQVPADVTVQKTFRPEPFIMSADPGQLRQVVSNLFTNALQSMKHGGEIRIDAFRNDDYDVLVFHDDGEGVSDHDRGRLFEPLFTTKAKGTGLGLTICRQIIERHGGSIEFIGEGMLGAAFRIRLPRAADMPEGEAS